MKMKRTISMPLELLQAIYEHYYDPANDYRDHYATRLWDDVKNLEGCAVGGLLKDKETRKND